MARQITIWIVSPAITIAAVLAIVKRCRARPFRWRFRWGRNADSHVVTPKAALWTSEKRLRAVITIWITHSAVAIASIIVVVRRRITKPFCGRPRRKNALCIHIAPRGAAWTTIKCLSGVVTVRVIRAAITITSITGIEIGLLTCPIGGDIIAGTVGVAAIGTRVTANKKGVRRVAIRIISSTIAITCIPCRVPGVRTGPFGGRDIARPVRITSHCIIVTADQFGRGRIAIWVVCATVTMTAVIIIV